MNQVNESIESMNEISTLEISFTHGYIIFTNKQKRYFSPILSSLLEENKCIKNENYCQNRPSRLMIEAGRDHWSDREYVLRSLSLTKEKRWAILFNIYLSMLIWSRPIMRCFLDQHNLGIQAAYRFRNGSRTSLASTDKKGLWQPIKNIESIETF